LKRSKAFSICFSSKTVFVWLYYSMIFEMFESISKRRPYL
jgi:hypothetical protein